VVSQVGADLKTAATIYEKRVNGSIVNWGEDNSVASFQTYAIPFFYDTSAVDSVTRITGGETAVFALDPASGAILAKTTSFEQDDGSRLVDFALDAASPAASAIAAGEAWQGEVEL